MPLASLGPVSGPLATYPAYPPASNKACADVDGKCEHGGVEEERDDRMQRDQPAQGFCANGNVGGLGRSTERGSKVEEIPIVRRAVVGKLEAARELLGGVVGPV